MPASPSALPEMRDSPARVASLRQWLERIVATLPEPRQRMYDLFVTRGLDSRNAALELAATVAEVRRLRRENRQAILRAFEVTALAAAEAAVDPSGIRAPGCAELRQILADARSDDGDPHEDGRRHTAVLPAALRLTLSRHLSQCRACQDRRDDCMGRWAPELLPILADAELHDQVMEDVQSMPGAQAARRRARCPSTRRPGRPGHQGRHRPGRRRGRDRAACGTAAARVRVARGSARNASCHGRVVAGPEQGRHQRRRCPEGDRHRRRGPRRQPRATGPPAGGRPAEHSSAGERPGARPRPRRCSHPCTTRFSLQQRQRRPPRSRLPRRPRRHLRRGQGRRHRRRARPRPRQRQTPTPSTSTPTPTASTSTPTPTPSASTSTPTPTTSASTPTPTTSASTPTPTPSASTSEPTPSASASATSPTSASPTPS